MSKIAIMLLLIIALGKAAKDYGYFTYSTNIAKTCQGPKRKDCCVNTVTLSHENVVSFIMDCRENMSPTKGKIVALVKNHQKVRLQMDKPCKHLFIKPILMNVFNATESCIILKHTYRFTLDFSEIAQKYYSGMFIYGNWSFQSMFFNDVCNFLCLDMEVNMSPKKDQ